MKSFPEEGSPERESQMNIGFASTPIVANQINLNLNRIRNGTFAGLLIQNFNCCRTAIADETDEETEESDESPLLRRRLHTEARASDWAVNHLLVNRSSSEVASTIESETADSVDTLETRKRIVRNLTTYYRRSEFRWSPIPWANQSSHSWEDVYVEAQLQDQDSGRILNVKNMLDHCGKVLVCGRPGSGLSAMCINLVRDWTEGRQVFNGHPPDETVVLMLRLRYATSAISLEEALMFLLLNKRKYTEYEQVACRRLIETTGRRFVVILDGFEEASVEHRKQVEQLLRCEPASVFSRASFVVTRVCTDGLPCMDDKTVSIFDRHYSLSDLSGKDCLELVRKYFPVNTDEFYRNNFHQIQLVRPHPLLLSMICYCGGWQPAESCQEAYAGLVLLIASRNNADLTQEDVMKKLDKMGEFFWPYARDSKHVFVEPTLRNGLGDLFDFARDSGLIRSSDVGVWETSHSVLMETTVARYLERSFSDSCKDGRVANFLRLNSHNVKCLNVTCYPLGEGDAELKVEFEFLQFRYSYQIFRQSDQPGCRVSIKSLEASDEAPKVSHDLHFRFNISLNGLENNREILNSLKQIFPKCSRISRVSQFFLRDVFTEVRVNFVSRLEPGANPYMYSFEDSLELSEQPVLCLSDPMWTLRIMSRNLNVVFASPRACCFQVVKSVLSKLGQEFDDNIKEGPLDHVQVLGKDPKFSLAVIDYGYTQVIVTKSKVHKKKEGIEPWSLFVADTSWQSCNRIEIYFGRQPNFQDRYPVEE